MDIDLNQYKICENYRDNDYLRNEFFNLVRYVFPSTDFEKWYLKGYWAENYIPYSILVDNKIIANASISKMNLLINGKNINGIQFGTVGTLPEYQKQGFSRILMDYVLHKYQDYTDIFFLFANDTVLDFYPKFGFKRFMEFAFVAKSNLPQPAYSARKLNINNKSDISLISDLLKSRFTLTEVFGAVDYDFITMWHILNIYPNNLYYLNNEEAIFILTEEKDKIHIWDVIFIKPFDIEASIANILKSNQIKSIIYYFPPDQLNYNYDSVIPFEESPLFIRGNFAIDNPQFKFPITAQT